MDMKRLNWFLVFFAICFSYTAFAQAEGETDVAGLIAAITALVTNWKALGTLGILSTILSILVGALKTNLLGSWFMRWNPFAQRFFVVFLGQVVSIIALVTQGSSWLDASVSGLLVSGGAMAIYTAAKPLWKKA